MLIFLDEQMTTLIYFLITKPIILKSRWKLQIKSITTISSHVTLFKSLQNIPHSSLESLILRPNIDEYELSPLDQANFPPLLITEVIIYKRVMHMN